MDGFVWVDKPAGPTSHDVVQMGRRALRTRKIGHAGTLDPMATGLLILGVGKGTRLLRFAEAQAKEYRATVVLGRSTTTEDAAGDTVAEAAVEVSEADVRAAAGRLVGELAQTVPAYSAVKVGGVRLHARARRGEAVDRPTRTVRVHRLTVEAVRGPEIDLVVDVSKGTYVRTLAVQLGDALGLPAHLGALRRLRIGPASVEEAVPPEALAPQAVRSLESGAAGLHRWEVSRAEARALTFGQALSADAVDRLAAQGWGDEPVAVFTPGVGVVAVGVLVSPGVGRGEGTVERPQPEPGSGEGTVERPRFRLLCVLRSPEDVSG
jgi:tRNA pseudouridine55 synthase